MYNLPLGEVTAHEVTGGCWIDRTVDTSLHDHHVIPQAAGGRDGPQVRICSDCHNAIHDAADKGLDVIDYIELPDAKKRWTTRQAVARAGYLIRTIRTALEVARQSANKTTGVNLKLNGEENARLEYLAQRLRCSKYNAAIWAIMNVRI